MVAAALSGGLDARVVATRPGITIDVDLGVAPGETAAVLGPNGAGKSTTLAAIAGLVPVEEGRISLGGRVLDDPAHRIFVPPERRRIALLFQDHVLFPHMTVEGNVGFALRVGKETPEATRREVRTWLERLDIAGLAGRRAGRLSGGQAQRVALARALASAPRALLLDEPLSALDAGSRVATRRLLGEILAEFAGPRILVTHDPGEAFLLADRIHVMEDGRVTQAGDSDQIRLRPRTRYAADLAGANLLSGLGRGTEVVVDGHPLQVAEQVIGPVLLTVHPRSVSLHHHRPEGSPRNTWPTRITLVEDLGERVRLRVGPPLPLTVEITPAALRSMGLAVGDQVWVSLKATEIGVEPG